MAITPVFGTVSVQSSPANTTRGTASQAQRHLQSCNAAISTASRCRGQRPHPMLPARRPQLACGGMLATRCASWSLPAAFKLQEPHRSTAGSLEAAHIGGPAAALTQLTKGTDMAGQPCGARAGMACGRAPGMAGGRRVCAGRDGAGGHLHGRSSHGGARGRAGARLSSSADAFWCATEDLWPAWPPSRQPLMLRLVLRGAPGSFAKGLPVPASAQPCKSLLAALRRHDRRACGGQGAATTSRCSRTARRRCSRRRSRRGARARLRCSAPTCSLPRRPSPASASGAGARARPRWQRRSCVSRVGPSAYPCRAAQASDGLARACKPSA